MALTYNQFGGSPRSAPLTVGHQPIGNMYTAIKDVQIKFMSHNTIFELPYLTNA
jgi:hypothetical protein